MVALEKHSSQITKIYCLEHKLAIFENFIHTFEPFKTIDTKINAINSWFNYRDGKYNLELKPLKTFSTTRPWRSHLQNYTIFCRNFTSYIDIAMTDRTFPEIHPLNEVKQILEFESIYCQNFDKLEAVNSDLNTALICYINIIYLFETNELALRLKLTTKFISNIAEYILSPVACAFYVLSKIDIKGNFIYPFYQKNHYSNKHSLIINLQDWNLKNSLKSSNIIKLASLSYHRF